MGERFLDFTFDEVALFYCTVNSSGEQQIDVFAGFSSRATPNLWVVTKQKQS